MATGGCRRRRACRRGHRIGRPVLGVRESRGRLATRPYPCHGRSQPGRLPPATPARVPAWRGSTIWFAGVSPWLRSCSRPGTSAAGAIAPRVRRRWMRMTQAVSTRTTQADCRRLPDGRAGSAGHLGPTAPRVLVPSHAGGWSDERIHVVLATSSPASGVATGCADGRQAPGRFSGSTLMDHTPRRAGTGV